MTKSRGVPKESAAAALAAARTFGQTPSLPLDAQADDQASAMVGRRRLSGAFFIELARIRPDPSQPRKNLDTDSQRELTKSVTRHGVIQPISVRFLAALGVYQIISGERRYHAATAAGLAEIPCIVHEPAEREILVRQLVENWQRVDLKPFEIADALLALREVQKCTQRDLADMTGKSESEISKLLALLDLTPEVQKAAREDNSGRLSRRHLYALAKVRPADQPALLDRVLHERLTADAADEVVAMHRGKTRPPAKRGAPVHRVRVTTSAATVQLIFRRKHVSTQEILAALDEAREQVANPMPELNIVRTKY